jgi:MFS family permease
MIGGSNFLSIALLGELSDAKGRRLVLSIALLGQLCSSLLWVFSWQHLSPVAFIGMQALCGLSGGQFAVYGAIFSGLSDMLVDESVERRAVHFGLMTALLFLGLVIGPLVIGLITTQLDVAVSTSFGMSASLYAVLLLLLLSGILRETRVRLSPLSYARCSPVSGIWLLVQNPTTRAVLGVQVLCMLGYVGISSLVPMITITKGFSNLQTDAWLSCLFGSFAIGNILLVEPMTKRFGAPGAVQASCLFLMAFQGWFGLALQFESLSKFWILILMCLPNALAAAWDAPLRYYMRVTPVTAPCTNPDQRAAGPALHQRTVRRPDPPAKF